MWSGAPTLSQAPVNELLDLKKKNVLEQAQ